MGYIFKVVSDIDGWPDAHALQMLLYDARPDHTFTVVDCSDLLAALEKVISRIYLPEEWEQDVADAIAKARREN